MLGGWSISSKLRDFVSGQPKWKRDVGPQGTRRRVRALCRRLEKIYGPFVPKSRRQPLDELILTVLSQATNDRNSLRAYAFLKERFPTWSQVLEASQEDLEDAIRPGGLAHNKSQTIRAILETLHGSAQSVRPKTTSGNSSSSAAGPLEHLVEVPLDDAMAELTALPGVGLKTAACVLLFSCSRPVMPVDTHVHRLSGRLGLVRPKATADQTHHVLMAITPQELVYLFHVWLIAHGRSQCQARNPRCSGCTLCDLCPTGATSR